MMHPRSWPAVVVLLAAACSSSSRTDGGGDAARAETTELSSTDAGTDAGTEIERARGDFGSPPPVPSGPLDLATSEAAEALFGRYTHDLIVGDSTRQAIATLGASEDPRVAWWLSDLLRVTPDPELAELVGATFTDVTGVEIDPLRGWTDAADHLIAWDLPAPPDYLRHKRTIHLAIEPRWAPLFPDDSDIDWRLLSWGGVLIDDRPHGETDAACRCIPAVDDPAVTDAAGGDDWLAEDAVVFGVVIGDEARAYPRSVMEVREMVNDTLGGRDFAMPYCTLCGSAQVFFTDDVDGFDRPVLRTSGLLSRSNKVMYDVRTWSVLDTFTGEAVSGPLWEAGIELDQHSVITTTWGAWKEDHPATSVVDVAEALGRPDSDLRNTRDADGPIFPIGEVDDRLPVQADVLGVTTPEGGAIAFDVAAAAAALERGEEVAAGGVRLVLDGGGVRAVDDDGRDVVGHQAFWFAWSQFNPDTGVWTGP